MKIDTVVSPVLWLHILAGFTAFFIAPVPLLTAKGGATHRRWGKIYFWAMAVVAASATFIALYRPIYFLALVAVFSFYFAFRGYRVLSHKNPQQGQGPQALDWAAATLAFAGSAALLILGLARPTRVSVSLGMVAVVFGVTGGLLAGRDIWQFLHPSSDRNFWWYSHMGGMIGSYIAAVSAFSVVNFHFLPLLVRWLWPTVIGVPAIFIWIGRYRKKFASGKVSAAAFRH
jgi:hypothetical protein